MIRPRASTADPAGLQYWEAVVEGAQGSDLQVFGLKIAAATCSGPIPSGFAGLVGMPAAGPGQAGP